MKKLNQKMLRTCLGLVILVLAVAALVSTTSRADETAAVSTNAAAAAVEYVADIDQVIAQMQKEGIQTNAANIYSELLKASKEAKYLIRLDEGGWQMLAKYRKLLNEAKNPVIQPDMETIARELKVIDIDKVVERMQAAKEELNGRNLFVAVGKLHANPDPTCMALYSEQKASYAKYANLLEEGRKTMQGNSSYGLPTIAREAIQATKTNLLYAAVDVPAVIQDMQRRGVETNALNLFVAVYNAAQGAEKTFIVPYKAGIYLPYLKDLLEGERLVERMQILGEKLPDELGNYKSISFIPGIWDDRYLLSSYQEQLGIETSLNNALNSPKPGMFEEKAGGFPKISGIPDEAFVARSGIIGIMSSGQTLRNYYGMSLNFPKDAVETNRADIQFSLLPINRMPQKAMDELNLLTSDLNVLRQMDQPPTGATLKIPELSLEITVTAAPDSLYEQFQLPRGIGVQVTECVPEKMVKVESNRSRPRQNAGESFKEQLLTNPFRAGDIILKARGQWVTTPPHLRDILLYDMGSNVDDERTQKTLKTPAFVSAWGPPPTPMPEQNDYAQFIVVRNGKIITLKAPVFRIFNNPIYQALNWRAQDPDYQGKDDLDFWWGRLPMNVPDIGIRSKFVPDAQTYPAFYTGYIKSPESTQAARFYNVWQNDDKSGLVIGKLDADTLAAKAGLSSYAALVDVTLPSDIQPSRDKDGNLLPATLFEERNAAQRINSLAHFYTLLEMEWMRSGSLAQVTLYGYDGANEEMLWMNLNPDRPERFGIGTARSYIEKQDEILEAEANQVRSLISLNQAGKERQKAPANSSMVSVQKRVETVTQPVDKYVFKGTTTPGSGAQQVLSPSITGLFDDRREALAKRWKECCEAIDDRNVDPDLKKNAEMERKQIEAELDRMDFYFGPNALNRPLKAPQNEAIEAKLAELAQKWKEISERIDDRIAKIGGLGPNFVDVEIVTMQVQRGEIETEMKLLQNIVSPGSVVIDPFERRKAELAADWMKMCAHLNEEPEGSQEYERLLKWREKIAKELETIYKRFGPSVSDNSVQYTTNQPPTNLAQ
ncbi:MAG: hypothetical protein M0Q48_10730 [Verrucomicrobia bacterium]|nr:hypothetical protein [Verrucomicrobiota bacterium]